MEDDLSHLAAIFGCAGKRLSAEEKAFFAEVRPWGFILFARNVESADQVRALNEDLRAAAGDPGALVFVDQEGGRVQRLKPPLARLRRPAEAFGALYDRDPTTAREAVTLNHRLLAHELRALGFDADCAPVLDLRLPEGHDVIGDRAFGRDPSRVSDLGRAAIDGLLAGGVAAGDQAHPRPWPRHRRQPPRPAGGRDAAGGAGADRLRPVPRPGRRAHGHDRPCRIHGGRPGRLRHHLAPRDRAR